MREFWMALGIVACRTVIEQFPGGLASAAIFPRYCPSQSAGSKRSRDWGMGRLAQSVARVIIVGSSYHSLPVQPVLRSIWVTANKPPLQMETCKVRCFTFWFLQLHWWQIERQRNLGSICSLAKGWSRKLFLGSVHLHATTWVKRWISSFNMPTTQHSALDLLQRHDGARENITRWWVRKITGHCAGGWEECQL